jgi:hypothetical protein
MKMLRADGISLPRRIGARIVVLYLHYGILRRYRNGKLDRRGENYVEHVLLPSIAAVYGDDVYRRYGKRSDR